MRGVDDLVHQLVRACVDVQEVNPRHGHHHITRRHVSHANHTFQHGTALCANHIVVFGVRQGFKQLVFRVWAWV